MHFSKVQFMYIGLNFNFTLTKFSEKCQIDRVFCYFLDFRQILCAKSSSSWIPGLGGTDCSSCGCLNQLIQESKEFDLCPYAAELRTHSVGLL